jgi:hypothetical protein
MTFTRLVVRLEFSYLLKLFLQGIHALFIF